jgi:hypothetical protein
MSLYTLYTEREERMEIDVPIGGIKLQRIRRPVQMKVFLMAADILWPSIDSLRCKYWILAREFSMYKVAAFAFDIASRFMSQLFIPSVSYTLQKKFISRINTTRAII